MQDRVGEEFEAMVLNPAKYGLFVELKDLFVEGLVPIETMISDRFTYRENTREIVGVQTGKVYRAGDQVRVILDRVLAIERKLQFALVEPPPLSTKKGGTVAGKPPKKAAIAKAGKAKASRREATRPGGKRKFSKKGRPRK
jgi:ribonuclease R